MRKGFSRMIAVGAIAVLAGAMVPPPGAHAQALDTAGRTIECAIAVEQNALRCKEIALKTLVECIDQTNSQSEVTQCDWAGEGALGKCELTGAAGDLKCQLNPNSAGNPASLE